MSPALAAKSTPKGEETRAQILAAAVQQASASGFESLTIGSLAEKTGMSKSGLFAHFGSKLELQMAALDEAARQFSEAVFLPAMKVPRGLRRLHAIFENWLSWTERARLPGGCPIDAAMQEYDHRPGTMRDAICERHRQLGRELTRAVRLAMETGELAPATDPAQIAFGMLGTILVFYRARITLGGDEAMRRARLAFEQLLQPHLSK